MPYRGAGPPLASGPPERVGQTARQNTENILTSDKQPCFYNNKRAWIILGYGRPNAPSPKPSFRAFQTEMRSFWAHHARYDKTRDGRKARALVLDALRTLGIRSLWWTSSMKALSITGHDGTFGLDRCAPGHGTSGSGGGYGKDNSIEYQKLEPPTCYQQEHHSAGEFEIRQWQKYHRYQGFFVADRNPDDMVNPVDGTPKYEARFFRAIAVPEGPDSLWYALSYHTGGKRDGDPSIEGPYIGSPWVTKMRIWTYLVQTLKDSDHERWRDYHILNSFSKKWVEGFGECSLLRSLYAGKDQGRPAYSAWPSGINYDAIFHVVADYFCTQVVVFAIDACLPKIDPVTGDEYDVDSDKEVTLGERPHILPYRSQANKGYQYRAYGRLREGEYKQILLATSDWKHFDAVDWDQPCHWKPSYFPKNWPDLTLDRKLPRLAGPPPKKFPLLTAEERMAFERPFKVDETKIRETPAPWWKTRPAIKSLQPPYHVLDAQNRPPCQQARYNRIERHYLPRDEHGQTRMLLEYPIDLVEQNDVAGPLAYSTLAGHQSRADTLVDDEIVRHFIAHHDIPGWSFKMPPEGDVDLWLVPHQRLIFEQAGTSTSPVKERQPPKLIKDKGEDEDGSSKLSPKTPGGKKPPLFLPIDTPAPKVPQMTTPGTVARYVIEDPDYRQTPPRFRATDDPPRSRYQIRFGPPPKGEDGKVDEELKGENLSLLGMPEIQFTEADVLKWT